MAQPQVPNQSPPNTYTAKTMLWLMPIVWLLITGCGACCGLGLAFERNTATDYNPSGNDFAAVGLVVLFIMVVTAACGTVWVISLTRYMRAKNFMQ